MDGEPVTPQWPRMVRPKRWLLEAPDEKPTATASATAPALIAQTRAAVAYSTFTDADLELFPDPVPLVAGMLWRDTLAVIFGKWESYKTFLALMIAFAVQTGTEVFGRAVTRGDVLYLFGEGRSGFKKRLRALKRLHNASAVGIRFLTDAPQLTMTEQLDRALATVRAMPRMPALIVIDTAARHFRGNENDQQDMSRFVEGCDALRRAADGATILIVHHTGHESERGRGSSALPAAVDTEIRCTRKDGTEEVTVDCTKSRDAERFAPITLQFHQITGTESGVLRPVIAVNLRTRTDDDRVTDAIREREPVSVNALRKAVREGSGPMGSVRFDEAKRRLESDGRIRYGTIDGKSGWCLEDRAADRAGGEWRGTPSGTANGAYAEADAASSGTPKARAGALAARSAGTAGLASVPQRRGSIDPGGGTLAPEGDGNESLSLPFRAEEVGTDEPAVGGGEELL